MTDWLLQFDDRFIAWAQRSHLLLARCALFIVYFWFGILKLFDASPANPLVADLLARTMPFISFGHFIIVLGSVEMIIGLAFLIRGFERVALGLLALHMVTTFMPLVLLPAVTWQGIFTPTLEGQYIIKNLLIIAAALTVAAHMKPLVPKASS